ncbi:MAG: hypothetical protein KDB37_16960 [Ilumatobacter sp.]|nr:hypothetical protein [Ilumatobacter sp.]
MSDWQHIRYEQPAERVARIVLARADMANAQDYRSDGRGASPLRVRCQR